MPTLLVPAASAGNEASDVGWVTALPSTFHAVVLAVLPGWTVQVPNSQAYKGDKATPDLAHKLFQDTFGGRPLHISWNALPGRIDGLVLDNWYIGELEPLELYDFGGGQVVAPVPDIPASPTGNNTYLASHMFSYVSCWNLVDSAPKSGVYITGATQPTV